MRRDATGEELPFARFPAGLAPLGYRNFALFWIGHVVSNTGRWIELTGTVWLVYTLTDSALLLGILGVVRAVPTIALSPFAGVISDRVDQRRMLFVTQGLSLLFALGLGILVATGNVEVWHVYAEVAIQSAIFAFDAALRQALFPTLVPRALMPEAVTLTIAAGRTSLLAGPAIGGLAIASVGVASPFLINAASFLGLMAALVMMRELAVAAPALRTSFVGEMRDGLRYLMRAPVLRGLLELEIVFGVFQLNSVIITLVATDILHVGPSELGLLLAAPALGSLLGIGLVLSVGQPRRLGRFIIGCTLTYCIGMVVFAVSRDYILSLAVIVVTGLLDALVTVARQGIVQLDAPAHMRGRVTANFGVVTRGVAPLAQSQSGILASLFGSASAVVLAAAALALTIAGVFRANDKLRHLSIAPEGVAPDPGPDVALG